MVLEEQAWLHWCVLLHFEALARFPIQWSCPFFDPLTFCNLMGVLCDYIPSRCVLSLVFHSYFTLLLPFPALVQFDPFVRHLSHKNHRVPSEIISESFGSLLAVACHEYQSKADSQTTGNPYFNGFTTRDSNGDWSSVPVVSEAIGKVMEELKGFNAHEKIAIDQVSNQLKLFIMFTDLFVHVVVQMATWTMAWCDGNEKVFPGSHQGLASCIVWSH